MPLLVAAVLTMSAAQLLDLATFVAMVHAVGPIAEGNPLVSAMFASHGFPMVAIAKVTLLALTTGIAAVLIRPPQRTRLVAAVLVAGILVGVIGGLSNSMAIGAI